MSIWVMKYQNCFPNNTLHLMNLITPNPVYSDMQIDISELLEVRNISKKITKLT